METRSEGDQELGEKINKIEIECNKNNEDGEIKIDSNKLLRQMEHDEVNNIQIKHNHKSCISHNVYIQIDLENQPIPRHTRSRKHRKDRKDKSRKKDRQKDKSKKHRSRSRSRKNKTDKDRKDRKKNKANRKKDKKPKDKKESNDKSLLEPKIPPTDKLVDQVINQENLVIEDKVANGDNNDIQVQNEVQDYYVDESQVSVMIENLPLSIDEFEIYNYLNSQQCGKIVRVKVFKGDQMQANCYIEFDNSKGVHNCLKLNNQLYKDKIIAVKTVDKLEMDDKIMDRLENQIEEKKYIYITGLDGQLSELQDQDIRVLFQSFGDIVNLQLLNNKSMKQSYGIIQFKKSQDAKMAVEAMNGFKFNNQILNISREPQKQIQDFINKKKEQEQLIKQQNLREQEAIKISAMKQQIQQQEQIDQFKKITNPISLQAQQEIQKLQDIIQQQNKQQYQQKQNYQQIQNQLLQNQMLKPLQQQHQQQQQQTVNKNEMVNTMKGMNMMPNIMQMGVPIQQLPNISNQNQPINMNPMMMQPQILQQPQIPNQMQMNLVPHHVPQQQQPQVPLPQQNSLDSFIPPHLQIIKQMQNQQIQANMNQYQLSLMKVMLPPPPPDKN